MKVPSEFPTRPRADGEGGDGEAALGSLDLLVRDALQRLYDPAALHAHPLAALLGIADPSSPVRSRRLRQALLDAIAALYPGPSVDTTSRAWRTYRLLELRYLEDQQAAAVMAHLALGKTQYHREHHRALRAVAAVLRERHGATEPAAPAILAAGELEESAVAEAARGLSPADDASVDPLTVVADIERLLQPLFARRGVVVRRELPSALPAVRGDRITLRHALLAVLSRAAPLAGGVLLLGASAEGETVRVRIAGRAAAPPPPEQLGVAASRPFVQALGGHIEATLDPAGDWRVDLVLRAAADQLLLVVDNSEEFITLVRRYLADTGWRVLGAATADAAFRLAVSAGPRAVLLDLVMPDQDGWDLLLSLRANAAASRLPVIICSVLDEPDVALALGAQACLQKPIDQQRLLATLAAVTGSPLTVGATTGPHVATATGVAR